MDVKLSEIGRNKATRADRNWRISGHSQTAVDAPEGGNLPKLTVPEQAYRQALSQVEAELETRPDDARRHIARGMILAHLGRPEEAIAAGRTIWS